MSEFINDVLEVKTETNDKGSYKVLVIDNNGKRTTKKVFNRSVAALFDGPGKYKIKYEKKGQYWNVAGGEKIVESQVPEDGPDPKAKPNWEQKDKYITAQVCVKAAADIVSAHIAVKKEAPSAVALTQELYNQVVSLVEGAKEEAQQTVEEEPPF